MTDEKKKEPDTSMSGTMTGYRVEAMWDDKEPLKIGDQMFTREWKLVRFASGQCGVPIGHRFEAAWLDQTHCYSQSAAEALRWWFIAAAAADPNGFGAWRLRTRLVRYSIVYSVAATRETEGYETHSERRVVKTDESSSEASRGEKR
jgi:hypothetical protein